MTIGKTIELAEDNSAREHAKALIDIALSDDAITADDLRQIAMKALRWRVVPVNGEAGNEG